MLNKVEVTAISSKILTLGDSEIYSYFKDKNINYIKSDKWISFDNIDGTKIKISKTGIVETKEFFEGKNVKEKLIKLANTTQNIASSLFCTKMIYDVFIHQEQNIGLNVFKKVAKHGEKIESISCDLKNKVRVEIKAEELGYWIILKGIEDIEDIKTVYDTLASEKKEPLKELGCKDSKAVIGLV